MDSFSAAYAARRSPTFSMFDPLHSIEELLYDESTKQHNAVVISCFSPSPSVSVVSEPMHAAYHDDTGFLVLFHNTKFSTKADKSPTSGKTIIGSADFNIYFKDNSRSPTPSPCTCTTSTSRPTRNHRVVWCSEVESRCLPNQSRCIPTRICRVVWRSEAESRCLSNRSRCSLVHQSLIDQKAVEIKVAVTKAVEISSAAAKAVERAS